MNQKSDVIALSTLTAGESCWVASIELNGLLRRRILDMGMVPGTAVECIRRSPAGDPIAFRVRDSIIALRHDDASNIKVYLSNNH
ncbi:iron transporter FeoA [Sporomusaceae bacterium FL31]|nr:iron transporter FeoA [Sporomusaceae bacterium FL31]GCE34011.1 iron transporter FeoA [Sporomusaceae bacterium]